MPEKKSLIPEFGPFAGLRVLCAGSLIAMPFAATMLADFGAEVINIERPGAPDTLRGLGPFAEVNGKSVSAIWAQDARNRLSMSLELNLRIPEAREVFFGLIRESDIFMENLVWLEKLGIRDEELMEANPRLVIVHVSGLGSARFGGLPNVCGRASYDMIGQAYSGWLYLQGYADRDPVVAKPYLNDFVSAYCALFGALAAWVSAQRTGRGQVVDVAQFEAMAQFMGGVYANCALTGAVTERSGNADPSFQPYDLFEAGDGALVAIGALGRGVYGRCVKALGFDPGYFSWEECARDGEAVASARGREFDRRLREWCRARTSAEIESVMEAARVPCSRVNSARDCLENEHFKSRGDWVSYTDQTTGGEVTAFGVAPKLSATPGRVWRGAPAPGQDTERILRERLGYDAERIAALREKGVI